MSAAPRRPEDRQSTGPCLCSDTSGNLALTRQPCGWKPLARRAPPAVVHPPCVPVSPLRRVILPSASWCFLVSNLPEAGKPQSSAPN